MKRILIYIALGSIFIAGAVIIALRYASPKLPPLTHEQIASDVKRMIPHSDLQHMKVKPSLEYALEKVLHFQPRIQGIYGPIDKIMLVVIDAPFREFPNILLYEYQESVQKWSIVTEGVTLGVAIPRSGHIDLHVLVAAIDFAAPEKPPQTDARDRETTFFMDRNNSVVRYNHFRHVHRGGEIAYYIDKSRIQHFAGKLLGKFYQPTPPFDTCQPFDTPQLEKITFGKERNPVGSGSHYYVLAVTDNRQVWTLQFDSIQNGTITNKVIHAERVE